MKKGFAETVKLADIRSMWSDTLGNAIARSSEPTMLRKGLLFIKVKNSVWMQELALLKEELMAALNRKLSREEVLDMRFKIGEIAKPEDAPKPKRPPRHKKIDLPPEVEAEIEERLKDVTSPEIKHAMKNLMARGYMEESEQDTKPTEQ